MRRLLVATLFGVLAVLPAVDAVCCPDGCTDNGHAASALQFDVSGTHAECGLCLNAVAVHVAIARVDPPPQLVALAAAPATIFISLPHRTFDRPPRL